jgi:hypothetical protein
MTPTEQMRRMITGYRVSQAIHVAATLRLSDLLSAEPQTVADLAAATKCDEGTLHRLLRALASVGVYRELTDGRYASTPLGDQLRSGDDVNCWALAATVGRPHSWQAWSALLQSVQSGENAFASVHGVTIWEYNNAHPEDGAIFDANMTSMSRQAAGPIAEAYDFGAFTTLVDVAGGRGALLAEILSRHLALRGILFDQPRVVANATWLTAMGVEERCEAVGGDMFVDVPPGGDAYMMKAILHDWEDPEALAILRNCGRAMAGSGTLLIIERLLDDAGPVITFGDLNMLVGPGGRERTQAEYQRLLATAGFQLTRVVRTTSDWVLIEAVPAG